MLCNQDKSIIFAVEKTFAAIAQSVEHFIRNEKVPGSSPGRGSKLNKRSERSEKAEFARRKKKEK